DVLAVAEQLHLDVPPALDVPLQVHPGIPERRLRLRTGDRDRVLELRRVAHDPQPAPPAAPGGLDENRVPDPSRDLRWRGRFTRTSRLLLRVSLRSPAAGACGR